MVVQMPKPLGYVLEETSHLLTENKKQALAKQLGSLTQETWLLR